MANLKEFRTDVRAINEGTWIPILEFGFEIQVRGLTDGYWDARTLRMQKAAEAYGNDEKKIPNAEQRRINASLMEDFLIIGVRNLLGDDGEPVSVETFHKLLYQEDYQRLSRMCFDAAAKVSTRSIAQLEYAEKNSQPASNSS